MADDVRPGPAADRLGEFVGPEATAAENTLTLSSGLAGLIVAPSLTAAARALPLGEAALLRRRTLRARPVGVASGRTTDACPCTLQPRAPASRSVHRLDRRTPGARVPGLVWAGSHYGYLMLATALVRRSTGQRRRLAAVALTLGGIVLDRALGSAAVAPWFGPVYYAKLLLGHAGAALWPVQPAGSTPRGSRAGSQSSSSTARSKA